MKINQWRRYYRYIRFIFSNSIGIVPVSWFVSSPLNFQIHFQKMLSKS